jgi:hypothetical protein
LGIICEKRIFIDGEQEKKEEEEEGKKNKQTESYENFNSFIQRLNFEEKTT